MNEILLSFWTIIVLVAIGYFLAKTGVTRPGADRALSRLTFNALIPALMFSTITRADPDDVFSLTAAGIVATATILAVSYVLLGRFVLNMSGGDIAIGSLVASYVNAGNVGLAYMQAITGDITIIAPIMIFQLCVMVPIYFAVLDRITGSALLTITVAGAFPTANNIFVYAAKYEIGIKLAREGILLTTIVSLPVTFAIAAVMT